jgi:hypothetical protein
MQHSSFFLLNWNSLGIHRSQRFFAGKNGTLFKSVDVLPGKPPRLIEQQ